MSEIGIKDQCFGVEVEMTGITREQAAHALADYFGTSPQYLGTGYDTWGATDPEGKVWKLMSDASIRAERKTRTGYTSNAGTSYRVEMVTPKLTYEELPKFQECIRRVRAAGAKVNSSCGIHVHVDAANHNRQSLKNLIGIMYSKEDILFKALQVNESRASRWCQKVREPMLRQARTLSSEETKDLTQLESIWYEGDIGNDEHYNWTRYYALNLHSVFYRGTVEWRCFNSTLHAGRAAAYVNLCLAISAQAIAQRSTVMRKTRSDNELFTFRVWLVRLGLNGDEFKHTRDHLLANLEGDRAWRYDKDSYADALTNVADALEHQQELMDSIIGCMGEQYDSAELYDILHNALAMSDEDILSLGFDLPQCHEYDAEISRKRPKGRKFALYER